MERDRFGCEVKKTFEGFYVPRSEGVLGIKNDCQFANYQIEEYQFAISKCKSFNCALDIGANFGIMSRRMARDFVTVESFEPIFDDYLEANLGSLNEKVNIHPYALGAEDKEVMMRVGKYNSGASNITSKKESNQTYEMAEQRTLDSFNFSDIGFIKMDVEGWEWEVFQGAEKTFDTDAVFMIEIHDNYQYKIPIINYFDMRNFKSEKFHHDYVFWKE